MFGLRSLTTSPKLAILTTAAAVAYAGYNMMKNRRQALPAPGPAKQDPEQLDQMLDTALEDSMAASDPPSTTQPDVRRA
ncbi:MAG: hypothetical protein JWN94_2741 [Betaproteobacteria bacterium]|nr:hypothetical protein [Betaproteobacteria bacterium]